MLKKNCAVVAMLITSLVMALTNAEVSAGEQLPGKAAFGVLGWDSLCMDAKFAKAEPGTPIQAWDCNSSQAQVWTLKAVGTTVFGAIYTMSLSLDNKEWCLDVPGSTAVEKKELQIWSCNNSAAQQWIIERSSKGPELYNIRTNLNARLCAELKSGKAENGTPIWLYACSPDSQAQAFKLMPK